MNGDIPVCLQWDACGKDDDDGPDIGDDGDDHDANHSIASVVVGKDSQIQHADGDLDQEERQGVPHNGKP